MIAGRIESRFKLAWRLSRRLAAVGAALLILATAPQGAQAGCCETAYGDEDQPELPDAAPIRLASPSGSFQPARLRLIGPSAALSAALPKQAEPHDEDRLPLGRIGLLEEIFERPVLDKVGRDTALGPLYRQGDAVTAVFDTEQAYRAAVKRLSRPVAIVTPAPFSNSHMSFQLPLSFQQEGRAAALRTPLEGPIGLAHGAEDVLALTPPADELPRKLF